MIDSAFQQFRYATDIVKLKCVPVRLFHASLYLEMRQGYWSKKHFRKILKCRPNILARIRKNSTKRVFKQATKVFLLNFGVQNNANNETCTYQKLFSN